MSIIKHVTLQEIVAHDFPYDPRTSVTYTNLITFLTDHVLYMLSYVTVIVGA